MVFFLSTRTCLSNFSSTCTASRTSVWVYLCAASGAALRCERLDLRGAGFSAGEELKMLSESSRGASGLVLRNRDQQTPAQREKPRTTLGRPLHGSVDDSLSEDDDRSSLLDVLGSDAMCDVVCCVTAAKAKNKRRQPPTSHNPRRGTVRPSVFT